MNELDNFLRSAKAKGATDEFLVALLKEHGWPASTIYEALGRLYVEVTGVAIPAARSRMESAREAFFHLLAFVTLGTWIFAVGSIWFELIDVWFPDPAIRGAYRYWRWSRMSWQMASIIVAFPAFVYATRSVLRDFEQSPDRTPSGVRRWLTNVALLITALVFIGDLMTFVASFLRGELTVRFVLQCLTVFVLAGAVFLYYSRGPAQGSTAPRLWHRGFALAAAVAILVSLGFGFMRSGSPADQRLRAEDSLRVQNLHGIAARLQRDWTTPQNAADRKLPATLAELVGGPQSRLVLKDPYTGKDYEYKVESGSRYTLCAEFSTATDTPVTGDPEPAWAHPKGRHCFPIDASQSLPWPNQID